MKYYVYFFRVIMITMSLGISYFVIYENPTDGLNFGDFLRVSSFMNLLVLGLVLADVRINDAISRCHFLALPVSDARLFRMRLFNILRNPWWFIPLTTPLALVLDISQPIDLSIGLAIVVYLSLVLTVSATYWIWDYLKLHGWENHLYNLYALALVMTIFIPKYGDKIWLLTNPFGGWLFTPLFLFEEFGFYQPASIIPALGLLSLCFYLMLCWSRAWYYLANE